MQRGEATTIVVAVAIDKSGVAWRCACAQVRHLLPAHVFDAVVAWAAYVIVVVVVIVASACAAIISAATRTRSLRACTRPSRLGEAWLPTSRCNALRAWLNRRLPVFPCPPCPLPAVSRRPLP